MHNSITAWVEVSQRSVKLRAVKYTWRLPDWCQHCEQTASFLHDKLLMVIKLNI